MVQRRLLKVKTASVMVVAGLHFVRRKAPLVAQFWLALGTAMARFLPSGSNLAPGSATLAEVRYAKPDLPSRAVFSALLAARISSARAAASVWPSVPSRPSATSA